MKRIVTVQDISCVGKCSLTVALPIISAMGVETAIIPTAVLSTHTMFQNFTCKDLTDQIEPITAHWKKEDFGFDAIYTGYLGSFEQIDIVTKMFEEFKTENNVIIVDPAMADNGKLYPAFDEAFAKKMATLCAKADIILPNITEASFMTGMEYKTEYDESYIKDMLKALTGLGAKIAVLTGVGFGEDKTGVMGYDSVNDEFWYFEQKKLPCSYHGTGDIFASAFTGALMNGFDWKGAAEIASEYVAECIWLTMADGKKEWYGVHFEAAIPFLLAKLGK
ncbi:MAG: pyridoxamine kinase [Lachnospiraceae bacterium]|nr:pyridoxamine kinase [Lachnospiraceae bacterium]